MAEIRLYDALARAFVAEDVTTLFTLMGDGNMHWVGAIAALGTRVVHARHEHCAVAMAIGHHSATLKPGVASVTCGPGLTQITTALVSASRARIPLVVFAGESPLHAAWHNQALEQAPFVAAAGGHYVRAHSPKLMMAQVCEAFHVARSERRPVVLGVPYDLQQALVPGGGYRRSLDLIPPRAPVEPDREVVSRLARTLGEARKPVLIGGRGAVAAAAGPAIERLADAAGALLATTLPARGLFDDHAFSLGVVGGFASETAREELASADLVLAFGAGMSRHMTDGDRMFPAAHVVQIDHDASGLKQGRPAADDFVVADARLTAEALEAAVAKNSAKAKARSPHLARRIAETPPDDAAFEIEPGTLDPRRAVEELDRVIPKDWDVVAGSGHSSYFHAHMRGRRPERFHVIREFGAIGNAVSIAIGVAASDPERHVVLLEGDGSLLMHIQELETMKRHGLKLLICVFNDGAYGAELHKLRADGVDWTGASFGRPDLAALARGFELRGATISNLGTMSDLMREHQAHAEAEVWDLPVSQSVVSPRMRNFNARKH